MATNKNELMIRIAADTRQANDTLKTLSDRFRHISKSTDAAADSSARLNSKLAEMGHLGAGLYVLQKAATALGASFSGMARSADEFAVATAKIKTASAGLGDAAAIQARLFDLAQSAGARFADVGDVYVSIARGANDLGMNQQRVLGVTENLTNAIKAMGGATPGVTAALTQLGQAIGSGQLRGEELNSVMEQFPVLAKAIADGMGRSVGELRGLAEAGKLTVNEVIRAIEASGPALAKMAADMPRTFSAGVNGLGNALDKSVDSINKAIGASSGFNLVVHALAQNMEVLVKGGIVVFSGALATAAVALVGKAKALLAAKSGVLALNSAVLSGRAVLLDSAQATALRAAASARAAQADMAAAQAAVARSDALLLELNAERASLAQMAVYGPGRARVEAQIAAATAARTAATNAATAAEARLAAAGGLAAIQAGAAAGKVGLLSRALSLVSSPLGLVATVVATAGAAWLLFGDRAKSAADKVVEAAKKAREATADMSAQAIRQQIMALQSANAQLSNLASAQRDKTKSPFSTAGDHIRLRELNDEIGNNNNALVRLNEMLGQAATGAGRYLDKYVTDGARITQEQAKRLALLEAEKNLNQVLARLEEDRRAGAFKTTQDFFAAQARARAAYRIEVDNIKKKGESGGKSASMSDPLAELLSQTDAARLVEYEKLLGLLVARWRAGTISATQYGDAVSALVQKTFGDQIKAAQEALSADAEFEAESQRSALDVALEHNARIAERATLQREYLDALEQEAFLSGLSNDERETALLLLEAEKLGIRDINALLALKARIQANAQVKSDAEELRRQQDDLYKNVQEGVQRAFADGLNAVATGEGGIRGALKNVVDTIRNALSNAIAASLTESFLGLLGGKQGVLGMLGSMGMGPKRGDTPANPVFVRDAALAPGAAGAGQGGFFTGVFDGFKNLFSGLGNMLSSLMGNLVSMIGNSIGPSLGSLFSLFGFAEGGWTGPGGKHQPAGVVHGNEYVFSAAAVRRLGVGALDNLHRIATGAFVPSAPRWGYADGGMVNLPAAAPAAASNLSAKIINVLDPSLVAGFLATGPGERAILNIIERNPGSIRTALS